MGGLDVLVNNAALYGRLERHPFAEIDAAERDRVMAVNVKGVWQMSRVCAPLMQAAAGGSIINVASATVFSGSPHWVHYVASKGAVIAMSRTMARELGPDNIRVNLLAPGFTMTEASLGLMDDARSYGLDRAAIKRPVEASDIVGAALFLASPHAAMMTGQSMIADGRRQFIWKRAMVQVTFIETGGSSRVVAAREGVPLIYAARDAGVHGIVAECGGSAMCGTCHCHVVALPGGPLPAMRPDEADTIEFNTDDPREVSRLICQIIVTAALDGAVFQVATGRDRKSVV